jgi:tetratricopeptide (TPR) repeat protein
MNMELHYDEESLAALAGFEDLETDEHLQSCEACREKLDSFRLIADALGDAGVWNHEPLPLAPVSSTLNVLRNFANQMASEDAQAERWLPLLLSGPRETWATNLAHHPEYRTAGMVRAMSTKSYLVVDTAPLDALQIARLSIEIAGHLNDPPEAKGLVSRLRGQASRDLAYMLFYTGDHAAALEAADVAAREFALCESNEYDTARLNIVRSLITRNLDQTNEAMHSARYSAEVFAAFGDAERYSSARSVEAGALFQAGRYDDALAAWIELERRFHPDDASDGHARALASVGFGYRHVGKIPESVSFYQQAAELFDALGTVTEAARTRWSVASLLAEQGRWTDAAERLESVRVELKTLGMNGPAAVATLDLAEVRLLQGRTPDVIALCSEAADIFAAARLNYTARAMRAVAYMREAAAAGRATPQLVREVSRYVRRLPAEPNLLFLSPDTDR